MKVSIVTISFNQARFLERAIRSVLEQDHDNIEYIVVDAGSTDGSREIIERYRDQIAKVIFEPDEGPADGLNKGFAAATGEVFGCINADDAYLPGAIGRAVTAFRLRPAAEVVCGHGYIVNGEGLVLRRFYSDRFSAWRYVHGGTTVMQQSTFFRCRAYLNAGGFNPENRIWWDGELLLDMCLAGSRFTVVDEFWSIFTIHETSISGQRDSDNEPAPGSRNGVSTLSARHGEPSRSWG
jgi:glycosyltransferase involved in cell wall biosynthesis